MSITPDYAGGDVGVMVSADGQVLPEIIAAELAARHPRAAAGLAGARPASWPRHLRQPHACCVLTLPLLLVVALAIKLDSRGPIFYKQERVGRHHRNFNILKLRSMTVDAEKPGAAGLGHGGRQPGDAGRPVHSPHPHRRDSAGHQHPAGRHGLRRARGRSGPSSSRSSPPPSRTMPTAPRCARA